MIQDSSEEDIFHLCTRYHTLRLRNDIHVEEKESNQAVCVSVYTGYGPKSRHARMQPLTRGPEDDETKTMTVARPQHVCMPLSGRRQHRPARSTCAAASILRSSPLGADMVGKSRNSFADMLFTPGLLALMPPTICCVRSQSVRDLVTEISCGATPAPVRCGSEL
jgi:hypothetical protein